VLADRVRIGVDEVLDDVLDEVLDDVPEGTDGLAPVDLAFAVTVPATEVRPADDPETDDAADDTADDATEDTVDDTTDDTAAEPPDDPMPDEPEDPQYGTIAPGVPVDRAPVDDHPTTVLLPDGVRPLGT
ncbi:MAG: hypothetical protein ACXWYP_02940, partial [Pseudonocardia sp.]